MAEPAKTCRRRLMIKAVTIHECVCVSVPCWLYYWIIQEYMVKVHYKVKMDFAKLGCE